MANTINIDAQLSSSMLIDIDKYRLKYLTRQVDESDDTKFTLEFVSPFIKVYENFKFFLLKNSVKKSLSPKNFYRPDYVSYEEYGTTNLWTLILFINNISSIEEFNVPELYIPDKQIIYTLISNTLVGAPVIDLDRPPLKRNDLYAKLFEKKKKPTLQNVQDKSPQDTLDKKYYFLTHVFPIRNITVSQKFVDLKYAAIPESLTLKVKDMPSYIYGIHYVLISNNGKMNRVTWSRRYVSQGLEDIITEGSIIEAKYAKEV